MKAFYTLIIVALLVGCGGGGGDNSSTSSISDISNESTQTDTQNTEAELTMSELTASSDFNFDIERQLSLSISPNLSSQGAINIYHQSAYVDSETGIVYPEPGSKLITLPGETTDINLSVNSSYQYLIVEWQPLSGKHEQQYHRIELSSDTDNYFIAL